MTRFLRPARTHSGKAAIAMIAATAGFAAATLVGIAFAKTFTLQVAKNAKVTNQSGTTKTENIVVNSRGFAVYMLTGDTRSHQECTKANGCYGVWPPLTVSSAKAASKAPGVKGKLGVWHHGGMFQVTLAGHPLYRFSGDSQRRSASGEGLMSFGGTWHAEKAAGSSSSGASTPATTMTGTTGTTNTNCLYPPC